jgi:hypothetical protein
MREQVERRLREHVRRAQMFLGVGLTVLVMFLTLAELTSSLPTGHLREILREGLVITGWVCDVAPTRHTALPAGRASRTVNEEGLQDLIEEAITIETPFAHVRGLLATISPRTGARRRVRRRFGTREA